jgi:exosortase F-associated protein
VLFRHNSARWALGIFAVCLLAAAYLFQRYDFSSILGSYSPNTRFVLNKSLRFIANDAACLLLIAIIFNKASYLRFSSFFFVGEMFLLLPLYFILKLSLEGSSEISSPFLSQLHRMVVNPLLMIVLMMGFFYQDYFSKRTE